MVPEFCPLPDPKRVSEMKIAPQKLFHLETRGLECHPLVFILELPLCVCVCGVCVCKYTGVSLKSLCCTGDLGEVSTATGTEKI